MDFKAVLALLLFLQTLQLASAQNSATLTVQFDNSKNSVVKRVSVSWTCHVLALSIKICQVLRNPSARPVSLS